MKKTFIFLLTLYAGAAFAQYKINTVLKKQLDSVNVKDQLYRDTLSLLMSPVKGDSVAKTMSLTVQQATGRYWKKQNRLDSLNLVFIEDVIKKYGYPGKTLVDTPANETAWYVIQHSPEIHKYIGAIKKAADGGEIPFHLYAMMLDRDLMNSKQQQVYGTQATMRVLKNGKNEWFIWPIKDAATVNGRRKKAGFPTTVEENAKRFDITYRVVTMDEVK